MINMIGPFSPAKETKIFTDSSTQKNASCSAYIVTQNGRAIFKDAMVFNNVTNNFGELYAIMMALTYIFRVVSYYRYADPRWLNQLKFTILSDSMYSVDSLTKWLPNWVRDTYRYNLSPQVNNGIASFPGLIKLTFNPKTKQKVMTPVMNTEVILECMKLVLSIGLPIRIMHTKAHLGSGHKALITAIKNHLSANKNNKEMKSLSLLDFEQMIQWNNAVDKLAGQTLQIALSQPGERNNIPSPIWPMVFFPTHEQLSYYISYIQ